MTFTVCVMKLYCCFISSENKLETRMHSSRMRTGRSLTVCRSLLLGEGCKKQNPKKKSPKNLGGVSGLGGVPGPGGGCIPGPEGGQCTWSHGGVPSPRGAYLVPGGSGPGGAYLVPGGCVWSRGRGCLVWGDVCQVLGDVWSQGCGIPACTEADTPPCEQNDKQV